MAVPSGIRGRGQEPALGGMTGPGSVGATSPVARTGRLTGDIHSSRLTRPSSWRVMNHEKNLSTKQPAPEEETRFSCANEDPQRTEDPGGAPSQGAPPAGSLSGSNSRRASRLRRRRDFQRVYRLGKRAHGRWLVLFALERGDGSRENRFGVTASRKVGGAVQRSRCKRRLRELYRVYGGVRYLGIDLVATARKGLDRAPWEALVGEYLQCLKKVERALGGPSGSSGSTSGGSRPRSRRRAASSPPVRNMLPKRSVGTDWRGADGWVSNACSAATPSTPGDTILCPERK